jgi:hypothetical protein
VRERVKCEQRRQTEHVQIVDDPVISDRQIENSRIHIYGGNILIAAHAENASQLANTTILSGDDSALKAALKSLGISDEGIKQLERDMTVEKEAIGPKVKKWMAEAGKYLSKEGGKAGVDVARKLATRWILQRYGIDLG